MDPVQYAQQLQNYLAGALLPDPVKQKQAEALLGKMSTAPYTNMFIPTLLRIVCNANVDISVRQIAAIKFKNSITKGWEYHDDYMEVPEELKPTLRAQMINVMCSVPHKLQAQISEAVRVMALKDFPDQWPDLLPSLVKKMATSTNPAITIGALKTSHEILKQFRQMTDSNANKLKLRTALTQFAEPVTEFFKKVEKNGSKSNEK
jgi:exportin-2 (importin alpha re-exporter)